MSARSSHSDAGSHDRWFADRVRAAIVGIEDGSNKLIPEEEWAIHAAKKRDALLKAIAAKKSSRRCD